MNYQFLYVRVHRFRVWSICMNDKNKMPLNWFSFNFGSSALKLWINETMNKNQQHTHTHNKKEKNNFTTVCVCVWLLLFEIFKSRSMEQMKLRTK